MELLFLVVAALMVLFGTAMVRGRGVPPALGAYLGSLLGGPHDRFRASGAALGAETSIHFTIRGAGDDARRWTEITVELPSRPPFSLYLWPERSGDRRRVERGEQTEVTVGDPGFDERFAIEAAPAAVVRALLTAPRRARLSSYRHVELSTITSPVRALELSFPDWPTTAAEAEAAVRLAVELALGVREAQAKVRSAAEAAGRDADGGEHAAEVEDAAKAAARRQRAEVRRLERRREARMDHYTLRTFALLIIALFALAFGMMVTMSGR